MTKLKPWLRVAVPCVLAASALVFVAHRSTTAADHFDPPARVGTDLGTAGFDVAADLADLYAFHDANNVYLSLSFGGPSPTNLPAFYDPDVLYTINVSNFGARTDTEFPIEIRFGRDGNEPGIQVRNLPGIDVVQGPVERNFMTSNGIGIRAGLFDDPFFFDPQGLRDTRATGNIAFNNMRNPFAQRNTTFVILSIPRALIDRGQPLDLWSTSARIRG
jgi:hypothetical protein